MLQVLTYEADSLKPKATCDFYVAFVLVPTPTIYKACNVVAFLLDIPFKSIYELLKGIALLIRSFVFQSEGLLLNPKIDSKTNSALSICG